jgi:uncharacterized protein YceK
LPHRVVCNVLKEKRLLSQLRLDRPRRVCRMRALHCKKGRGVMVRTLVIAVGMLCALSGCGTMENLSGSGGVYGGVRDDASLMTKCLTPEENPNSNRAADLALAAILLMDLPLSLVGDTVTLPLSLLFGGDDGKGNSQGNAAQANTRLAPRPGFSPAGKPAAAASLTSLCLHGSKRR